MSDIDHKAESQRLTKLITDVYSIGALPADTVFALAQIHATLYLAEQQAAAVEQQRVANLLAAAALITANDRGKHAGNGLDGWCVDAENDIHDGLAESPVWIALLGYDAAKRLGLTA